MRLLPGFYFCTLLRMLFVRDVNGAPLHLSGDNLEIFVAREQSMVYPSIRPPTMPGRNTLMPLSPSSTATASDTPTPASPRSSAIHTPSATPFANPTPQTNNGIRLSLINNLSSKKVHAYLTGLDSAGKVVFVTGKGQFFYPPAPNSNTPVPVQAGVAIPLAGQTEFALPGYMSSARLWVCDGLLNFSTVNTALGTGLVEPTALNPDDPSANVNWGYAEFTYNEEYGLYADVSFVDFLGLPLGMKLVTSTSQTESALGPSKDAVTQVCTNLEAQAAKDGQPWGSLCENDSSGKPLRVLSPTTYLARTGSDAFAGYWDTYVDQVIKHFSKTPLTINTQSAAGIVKCTTSTGGDMLTCEGDNRSYSRPSALDIFGCASGPFAIIESDNDIHRAVVPRLCAAFNRGTLLIPGGDEQPSLPPSKYYTSNTQNWYSAFVHSSEARRRGYAFPYDDVTPSIRYNTAGLLAAPAPAVLTVVVGGRAL